MKVILSGKVVTENEILEGKAVVFDEKIVDIIDENKLDRYQYDEKIDAKGSYVLPGFIDIHIHGAGGCDVMDGSIEALEKISETIASKGVTGFLGATMTMDESTILHVLDNGRKGMEKGMPGAKLLGIHMEGPFVSREKMGAQNPEYIVKPDYNLVKDYLDIIKIITLAPEEDDDYSFIEKIKGNTNIILSMGHTNASYEEAMEAIDRGITHATHTFNGMTPLRHREPGVVGAIMNSDISCELICDCIHVHPGAFNILIKVKGIENVILITDSMRAGCMEDGVYEFGGQEVVVKAGVARLKKDNSLAGSVLTLNRALKNIIENTDLNFLQAVNMISLNPAKLLGIEEHKGSLSIGKDADIVIMDNEFNVENTIVEGKFVF
jgi:N-acetylglucosamine-6-phosphate deacetylase